MKNNDPFLTTLSDFAEETDKKKESSKMNPTKQIKWFGWMEDSETKLIKTIELTHMMINQTKIISGFCSIEETILKINGMITEDELLEFEMVDKHNKRIFLFRGEMSNKLLYGKYRDCRLNEKGIFEFEFESENWIGYLEVDGKKDKMELPLNINYQGVYSIGTDENGIFFIDGNFNSITKKCDFYIYYMKLDKYSYYNGDWNVINDQFVKVSGRWNLPQSAFGLFSLTGKLSSLYHDVMNFDRGIFIDESKGKFESSSELLIGHLKGQLKTKETKLVLVNDSRDFTGKKFHLTNL